MSIQKQRYIKVHNQKISEYFSEYYKISLGILVLASTTMVSITGCASGAGNGAWIGAGTGAFFGSLFGGRRGAVAGAAIGGISGAAIGAHEDEKARRRYFYERDRRRYYYERDSYDRYYYR